MTQLTQDRLYFIEHLHQVFFIKKGYGALAFVSSSEIMDLFDEYQGSNESADLFINRFVKSI